MSFSILGFTIIRTRDLAELQYQSAPRVPAAAPDPPRHAAPSQASAPPQPPAAAPAELPRQVPVPAAAADGPPSAAREVIRLADGLLDLRETLDLSAGGGQPAETVLRWVDARTRALLTACDVKRVEESGTFDPTRQQAVANRAAPRPELAHQIADTVRPGYAWHGALLRPQQVIVYVPAND
jgi:hypothetical protein